MKKIKLRTRENLFEFSCYIIAGIFTFGLMFLLPWIIDGLNPSDFYHHNLFGEYTK